MSKARFLLVLGLSAAVTSCGGSNNGGLGNQLPPPLFSGVFAPTVTVTPVNPVGQYAAVLADCAYSATRSVSCTFGDLPLLGQSQTVLTVDDVMNRVVVSHDWMGQRFREALETLPQEAVQLFQGVTAIVIASDVIPSFYFRATAAIYLDARFLWLTLGELATINDEEDFRSGFGEDLSFTAPWRLLDNGVQIVRGADPNGGSSSTPPARMLDDIRLPLAYLLLHELAHANDFLPPQLQGGLRNDLPVLDVVNSFVGQRISDQLVAGFPLLSTVWFELAAVKFLGVQASATQIAMTPQTVGDEFKIDGAAMPYGFTTQFEDLATLFDELMLLYLFDVVRDNAITDKPAVPSNNDNDYIVAWGQRSRIKDALVKQRALFIEARILPNLDLSVFVAGLDDPIEMRIGEGWLDNLVLGPIPATAALTTVPARPAAVIEFGPGHVR
jgi:hypothetical protein